MTDSQEQKPSLLRLELTFFASGSTAKWVKFAKKIGAKVDLNDGDASFGALPHVPTENSLYIIGGFHPAGKTPSKSRSVHWHVAWISAPDGDPPERLRKRSVKVGGYPGVLERIREHWPHDGGPAEFDANFTAVLDIDGSVAMEKLDTRTAQTFQVDGVTVVEDFQSRSWAIQPSLGGLSSALFLQQDGRRQVHVSGQCRASFSSGFPAQLEARTWTSLKSLGQ